MSSVSGIVLDTGELYERYHSSLEERSLLSSFYIFLLWGKYGATSSAMLEIKRVCYGSMEDEQLNQLVIKVEEPQGELSGGGDT